MLWYVGRRVLQMIPVFFGATLLVYALVFLLPGDPIAALGGNRPLAPGVVAQLRHTYHLDQPFIIQYLDYLKGIKDSTDAVVSITSESAISGNDSTTP